MDLPAPANSAAADAARLVTGSGKAALATLDAATGHPYASLVTVALDAVGRPLMLLSQLARHTKNLDADGRASLLFEPVIDPAVTTASDPLAGARVTLIGRVHAIASDDPGLNSARERFLARHLDAAMYAGFSDFRFFRLELATAHFIGGFGRIVEVSAPAFAAAITASVIKGAV
ncbi:MAG: pyridoxamine 5'-phosphate oxidase family protein [Hyphomicrobium aestuarii]|nr:pyridoxamine 5'-phosphate oxidase family protein [Hyphomicrobium aestuarii]